MLRKQFAPHILTLSRVEVGLHVERRHALGISRQLQYHNFWSNRVNRERKTYLRTDAHNGHKAFSSTCSHTRQSFWM